MARITGIACIVAATAISPARSERAGAPSGPSKDVVTRGFTGAGGSVYTDATGSDGSDGSQKQRSGDACLTNPN